MVRQSFGSLILKEGVSYIICILFFQERWAIDAQKTNLGQAFSGLIDKGSRYHFKTRLANSWLMLERCGDEGCGIVVWRRNIMLRTRWGLPAFGGIHDQGSLTQKCHECQQIVDYVQVPPPQQEPACMLVHYTPKSHHCLHMITLPGKAPNPENKLKMPR
ncbi:hypothetical protein VTI74DRAFT_3286 [Chaetomium olivicolor]